MACRQDSLGCPSASQDGRSAAGHACCGAGSLCGNFGFGTKGANARSSRRYSSRLQPLRHFRICSAPRAPRRHAINGGDPFLTEAAKALDVVAASEGARLQSRVMTGGWRLLALARCH